jgi:glycosyltransferase involved in cell wall biosynthesis
MRSLNSEFNVTIGSFSENGLKPEFLNVISGDNIQTHTFDVKNAYDTRAIRLLKNYLIENKIDILCTHDYRSSFIGWRASSNANAKWIVFSRGWTRENLKVRVYQILDKLIIRFADLIVGVSHSQKEKLSRLLISNDKLAVVHNAVDADEFKDIEPIDLRQRFGFSESSIICICGGRFSEEKGQKFMVEAASMATEFNNNLRFILFGDGPDLPSIRKLIKRLDLEEYVFCPGFEKNFSGCLKGADILVNPSLSEGLPNIVLEAMAMKIPIIATDVGGVSELIENEKSGLIVGPGDPKAIAGAVRKLVEQPDAIPQIVDNGYKSVINNFSFEKQYETLTDIYKNVLSK